VHFGNSPTGLHVEYEERKKKTVFYLDFARFTNTVTLKMNMFLSHIGLTRRNTSFIFVWLRPRNTWTDQQVTHKHTPTENNTPDTDTHTHTHDMNNTPHPQTKTWIPIQIVGLQATYRRSRPTCFGAHIYIFIFICIFICIYIHIYIYIHICVCVYIYIYIYIYMNIYIYRYIYIDIYYIFVFISRWEHRINPFAG